MNSLSVLHVLGALISGGAENLVVQLLMDLKQNGTEVSLFVYSSKIDKKGKSNLEKLKENGINVNFGSSTRLNFLTIIQYLKFVQKIKPAVIHYHLPKHDILHISSKYIFKYKSVRTIHNVKTTKIEILLLKLSNYDHLIACSSSCYQVFEKKNISTILIRNGIKFNYSVIRNGEQINTPIRFCAVGRMEGEDIFSMAKGFDLLIYAWINAQMGLANHKLSIYGTGKLEKELKNIANNDKSISFLGISEDIQGVFLNTDVLIMPSRFEGLPLVAIEAIGSGLSCVFSDIPELNFLTRNVSYFKSNSRTSLTQVLIKFIKEPKFYTNKFITEDFRMNYSSISMMEKYLKVYITK